MGASTPPADHGDSATGSSLAPGIIIGRFQLLKKLGQGGMGAVFLARDPKLKRSVAIKLLTRREDHTGKRIARFKREARALAKLNHPGIVAVHEFGEHDGQHFLVMDLVKGRTFAQVLRQEDLPHRRIVELVRDVALALDHAHSAGIIHRDVKPENILISSDGLALLTDFGLAHDETAQEQLTKTGEILGTPHFMTPEQVSREMGEVGPWTDIHALGATLHEGLAGTPPFHATNVMALLRQVLKEDARPLHKIDSSIPRDVSVIVLKCLEKSPERRYPDASALADDLQRFLADEVVLAQSHGIVAKTIRRIARHRLLSATLLLTVLSATYSGLSSPESGQKKARQEQLSDLLKERKERRRAAIRQRADTVARDEAESDHRQAEQEDALRMALARTRFIDNLVNLGLVGDYLNRPTAKLGEIAFVRLPPNVTEEDIAHLAKLGQLHNLDFSGASIADAWLAHIQELTKLRDVNLGGTGITNSGVFYLAKLVQLTYLNLSKNPLTDSALQHIEAMTKLENLNLEKTRIGDEGLPHVGSLVKLKILHLSHTRVGDSALGSLQGMQRLEKLYLNDTRVTSLGLKNLAALPALQKLFLQNTMVDDSGLEMLKNARRLEHLSLIGTQVTAEAVQKLQRELPTCEIHFR